MDLSANKNIYSPAPGIGDVNLCTEEGILMMILEMLLGRENNFFVFAAEDSANFRLSYTAKGTRVQSLGLKTFHTVLDWFIKFGNDVNTCRVFVESKMNLDQTSGVPEAIRIDEEILISIKSEVDCFVRKLEAYIINLQHALNHDANKAYIFGAKKFSLIMLYTNLLTFQPVLKNLSLMVRSLSVEYLDISEGDRTTHTRDKLSRLAFQTMMALESMRIESIYNGYIEVPPDSYKQPYSSTAEANDLPHQHISSADASQQFWSYPRSNNWDHDIDIDSRQSSLSLSLSSTAVSDYGRLCGSITARCTARVLQSTIETSLEKTYCGFRSGMRHEITSREGDTPPCTTILPYLVVYVCL